jgi:hypothetical protein
MTAVKDSLHRLRTDLDQIKRLDSDADNASGSTGFRLPGSCLTGDTLWKCKRFPCASSATTGATLSIEWLPGTAWW